MKKCLEMFAESADKKVTISSTSDLAVHAAWRPRSLHGPHQLAVLSRWNTSSGDLPFNISRETLQQNKTLRVIKNNSVKEWLQMIAEIAEKKVHVLSLYSLRAAFFACLCAPCCSVLFACRSFCPSSSVVLSPSCLVRCVFLSVVVLSCRPLSCSVSPRLCSALDSAPVMSCSRV